MAELEQHRYAKGNGSEDHGTDQKEKKPCLDLLEHIQLMIGDLDRPACMESNLWPPMISIAPFCDQQRYTARDAIVTISRLAAFHDLVDQKPYALRLFDVLSP